MQTAISPSEHVACKSSQAIERVALKESATRKIDPQNNTRALSPAKQWDWILGQFQMRQPYASSVQSISAFY